MTQMTDAELKILCYLAVMAGLGIFSFFWGFKVREKKRMIENIPTSKARSVAMGLVEVSGKAQPYRELITTPFSKVDSVFYRYVVEELRRSGKSSRWVKIAEFSTADWFYIEDETGKVLVSPSSAELYLKEDKKYRAGGWGGGPEAEAFKICLAEQGIESEGLFGFDKNIRCTETYICPGDSVFVMGTAADNPLVEQSVEGSANICIQKTDGNYFCVSDRSEKDLLGALTWKMFFYIYGGAGLTLVCLYFFATHYLGKFF